MRPGCATRGTGKAFFAPAIGVVFIVDRMLVDDDAVIRRGHAPAAARRGAALVASHAAPGAAPPLWLVEGLAERWSANTGFEPATPASLKARDDAALAALLADFNDPARRATCVRPLADLVTLGSLADLDARMARMTATRPPRCAASRTSRTCC